MGYHSANFAIIHLMLKITIKIHTEQFYDPQSCARLWYFPVLDQVTNIQNFQGYQQSSSNFEMFVPQKNFHSGSLSQNSSFNIQLVSEAFLFRLKQNLVLILCLLRSVILVVNNNCQTTKPQTDKSACYSSNQNWSCLQ